MSDSERTNSVVALVLSLACVSAMGSEPNQPAIEVEFLESGSSLELTLEKPPPITPSHAADFVVQWRFEPTGEPNAADLLKTSAGKSFSALQRELLKSEKRLWLSGRVNDPDVWKYDMPFGSASYTAFAVSKEDAKRMGRAVLEFLIREEEEAPRRMKKDLHAKLTAMQSELREGMAKAKEEIEAKASQVSSAKTKYEDGIRNSPYSRHPTNEVPPEVLKTISEMDKMLDLLNIEIVGIQSKLSAIKKYSEENKTLGRGSLVTTLTELAIRQEIELVGAESRRQATMAVKRREEALHSLFEALVDLEQEFSNLERSVKQSEKQIRYLDRDIEFLGPGELTFYIDGGKARKKVAIQRVRVKVQQNESYPLYRN